MPFQKGNQLAANGKRWHQAIENALVRRNSSRRDKLDALDDIAERLLIICDTGDMSAIRELGDRLDGKAAQSLAVDLKGKVIIQASEIDEAL